MPAPKLSTLADSLRIGTAFSYDKSLPSDWRRAQNAGRPVAKVCFSPRFATSALPVSGFLRHRIQQQTELTKATQFP